MRHYTPHETPYFPITANRNSTRHIAPILASGGVVRTKNVTSQWLAAYHGICGFMWPWYL